MATMLQQAHECPPRQCFFNGTTGRMSIDEAGVISSSIAESVEPLMKWVAVKHAIERGDDVNQLRIQFPWLDLYDSDEESDEESEYLPDKLPDIPEYDPRDLQPTGSIERCIDIPKEITGSIQETWNLTPEQVDTIMRLISLPENGSTEWPLFYNYIEYGKDSAIRGYTTTIFGATSGTGSLLEVWKELRDIDPDHPLVVKYMDAIEKAKGGNIEGLEGLANVEGDPTKAVAKYSNWTPNGRTHLDHIEGDLARLDVDESWKRAVWRAFLRLNWESAAHFCNKTGPCEERPGPILETPLAKGFIVDTSLNHGDCRWWNSSDTWTAIWDEMDDVHPETESAWLKKFMKARKRVLKSGFQGLDWSKSGDRVDLWRDLIREDNMDLERPIYVISSSHNPPIWPPDLVIE